jgi:DNA-binding NarL/FixJ family response regulator
LEKYLERAGYAFGCCSTARVALALAETLDPDVVITEYHLPDANGPVLLERLTRRYPNVAGILLSEYDFEALAKDVDRATVRSILRKPFDIVDLEAALSSACSRARIMVGNIEMEQKACGEGISVSLSKKGTLGS